MKSLLITTEIPSQGYGSGQRALSVKKALDELGECRVLRLCDGDETTKPPTVDFLAPSGVPTNPSRLFWIFRNLNFGEFRPNAPALKIVEDIHKEYPFDLVFCQLLRSTGAAPHGLVPCMLDTEAMHHPDTILTKALWPLTTRMMDRCTSKFKKVFVIRSDDNKILHQTSTEVLPCVSTTPVNAVEVKSTATNLLFIGDPKWPPNKESIEHLIETVLPDLKQRNSKFKLRIVGAGTEAYAEIPGLSTAGFVDDIVMEYQNAAVVLCPIWSGRGANVKLAEALQLGCAVVTSEHAATGFKGIITPGTDLLTADSKETYADVLCDLLDHPGRIISLRKQAAKFGRTSLSQGNVNNIIAKAVTNIFPNVVAAE